MRKTSIFIILGLVAGAGAAWAAAESRDLAISAIRAEAVSAAPDNGAWVLTNQGSLLFCRMEQTNRVQCYDRHGAVRAGF